MHSIKTEITIPIDGSVIRGNLTILEKTKGIVIFAHGSGSSRFSPRNRLVADLLQAAGFSTLLFDLLTQEEDQIDTETREFRFNIPLLADRLVLVTKWVSYNKETLSLPIGYFGASTGAAAALIAAAQLPKMVSAVVSRGGRPDLAQQYLVKVQAPTLLIVGANDHDVIILNQQAYNQLTCTKKMILIPGATHLFEEPGTLQEMAKAAIAWFEIYVVSGSITKKALLGP